MGKVIKEGEVTISLSDYEALKKRAETTEREIARRVDEAEQREISRKLRGYERTLEIIRSLELEINERDRQLGEINEQFKEHIEHMRECEEYYSNKNKSLRSNFILMQIICAILTVIIISIVLFKNLW